MAAKPPDAPTYENYESRIPLESRYKLDKKVDFENNDVDLHLTEIAQVMKEWEDVAPLLGLKDFEITDIEESNRPKRRRVACLQEWKRKFSFKATYGVLLDVLIRTKNFNSADVIVECLGGQPADGTMAPQQGGSVPHPAPPSYTGQATPSQQAASDDQIIGSQDPAFFEEIKQCVQEDGWGSENLSIKSYPQQPKDGVSNVKLKFGTVTPLSGKKVIGISNVYPMDKWPHGIAVVINNEKFEDCTNREGTKVDEENLVQTLRYLGYVVDVYNDCTAQGIREIIDKYSTKNHAKYDSFICCILSHGTMGHVYGTDDYMVPVEEISRRLNADNCPTLAPKPKIFFMQCCQGPMSDKAVQVKSDGGDEIPEESSQILTPNGTIKVASDSDIKIPRSSGFYFSYATASGHKAWRHVDNGSWYVSELCKTLARYAKYNSLDQMMNIVNENVGSYAVGGNTEDPEVVKRVSKDIFFF